MKIGFLAMSGLRAHDPELLALGLTLPGVQERSRVLSSLPSLGLLYLAACTPAGHELQYFEIDNPDDNLAKENLRRAKRCDLVAISTFSAQVFEAYEVADQLRDAGVKVAMGGLHVSVQPEEAMRHADFVFLGEGEATWPHAITAIEHGTTQRIWDAADYPPVEVKTLPTPRYELLATRPYSRFPIQTTRGCPWRCDFCASNVMLNQPYRKRPIADIERDIRAVQQLRRRPFIELADDNTFVDLEWGKELCRALARLNVKWFTETDISVADDPELLELMRVSRCRQVLIGLESPTSAELAGVEMRSDFKRRRAAHYVDSLRRIQEHGITVNGCFVLGLDNQTPEVFDEIYDFVMSIPLYDVQLTILTPFPGTPLYARLEQEDRLIEPGRWDRCTLFDVNFLPKQMTVEQLRAGMRTLVGRLYDEENLRERRKPFFDKLWTRA